MNIPSGFNSEEEFNKAIKHRLANNWSIEDATTVEKNHRRPHHIVVITVGSETRPVAEWAKAYGISPSLIHNRIKVLGWQPDRAVTTPPRSRTSTSRTIYNRWYDAKRRCYDKNNKSYKHYGGRGISMCNEWIDDPVSYETYVLSLPNALEPGLSIDRIDNDGDYKPGNLRWSTARQQCNNQQKNTRYTHNGKSLTLSEWEEATGVSQETLRTRIVTLGWSIDRSLSTPVESKSD